MKIKHVPRVYWPLQLGPARTARLNDDYVAQAVYVAIAPAPPPSPVHQIALTLYGVMALRATIAVSEEIYTHWKDVQTAAFSDNASVNFATGRDGLSFVGPLCPDLLEVEVWAHLTYYDIPKDARAAWDDNNIRLAEDVGEKVKLEGAVAHVRISRTGYRVVVQHRGAVYASVPCPIVVEVEGG